MKAYDRVIFRGSSITIGRWHCPADAPDFDDTGPIENYLVVFPRTVVEITPEGGEPIIADPSVAIIYNQDQPYRRGRVSEEGDQCDWFGLSEPLAREMMVAVAGSSAADGPDLFQRFTGPCDPKLYLRQRLIVEHLEASEEIDRLLVEEAALGVVASALADAHQHAAAEGNGRRHDTTKVHRELAHRAKALLAQRFSEGVSLEEIAHDVHCSPFHLCRVFREQTGMTLTAYRNEQRLRRALERLSAERDHDLTRVALETGFSSHSHFTRAFRKAFGTPPSSVRRIDPGKLLKELDKTEQAAEPDASLC